MNIIIPRSPEWYDIRRGKVTASRIADVMARTKTGYGASRANYMSEIILERLTGVTADSFESLAMIRGRELEPEAKAFYAFQTNSIVEDCGFFDHPTIPMSGASPDGLVDGGGLIEVKCPNSSTHIETLLNDAVEGKYMLQMQWQMACSGAEWCDFCSYDPRMPAEMQLWIRRVPRDAAKIAEIEREVIAFLNEAAAKLKALKDRYLVEAAA